MIIDLSNTITGYLSCRVKKNTQHDRHWSNHKNLKVLCQVLNYFHYIFICFLKNVLYYSIDESCHLKSRDVKIKFASICYKF